MYRVNKETINIKFYIINEEKVKGRNHTVLVFPRRRFSARMRYSTYTSHSGAKAPPQRAICLTGGVAGVWRGDLSRGGEAMLPMVGMTGRGLRRGHAARVIKIISVYPADFFPRKYSRYNRISRF